MYFSTTFLTLYILSLCTQEESEGYFYYDDYYAESSYTITIDDIPNGTVCIAAGTYELEHESIPNDFVVTIPQKACSTPPSEQGDLLCCHKYVKTRVV